MREPIPASEFSRNFERYKDQATGDRDLPDEFVRGLERAEYGVIQR